MTYNVSSGTLNTTVPYRTRLCPSYNCLTVSADNTRAMQLFKILSSRRGFTRWLYRCLLMLIMRIVQIIRRSFVCRQSILVGQWPDRPSSGRERSQRCWSIRTTGVRCSSPSETSLFRESYAGGGGSVTAPINALHLLNQISTLNNDHR